MPIHDLFCLGISHKTGNIEQREQMATAVSHLTADLPHTLISTCNRVEIYTTDQQALTNKLAHWQDSQPAQYAQLSHALYQLSGEPAAAHLHEVAAGLDSMVLGEGQILGQIRQAYETAVSAQQTNKPLNTLFKSAIRTGKRVRTETKIAHYPASMSAIALQQAQNTLGKLSDKQFLLIGLGEMGRITLKALKARGLTKIDLANRSLHKAEALVEDGTAYALDQLDSAIEKADVIFCATSATSPIITQTQLAQLLPKRNGRSLILIDLAVPRDIETAVATLPTVTLINVDDLQTNLDNALSSRQAEIPKAKQIIAQEMTYLRNDMHTLTVTPTIKALREKAETIRQSELNRTLRHLKGVDDQTRQHIEHLSQALVKKLLHEPTVQLRTKAQEGTAESTVTAVRELFALTDL